MEGVSVCCVFVGAGRSGDGEEEGGEEGEEGEEGEGLVREDEHEWEGVEGREEDGCGSLLKLTLTR